MEEMPTPEQQKAFLKYVYWVEYFKLHCEFTTYIAQFKTRIAEVMEHSLTNREELRALNLHPQLYQTPLDELYEEVKRDTKTIQEKIEESRSEMKKLFPELEGMM